MRVTQRTVRRWRQAWQDGGAEALRSKGPVSREGLSPQRWARLEANSAAAHQASLVRIIKRKLKKIQYRRHLINGCLAATGLTSEP